MAESEGTRKLAAILSADVVGYSKLMTDDEQATVQTLKEYRAAIARVIERHKGRVVNSPGDNILADFPSAVEAVHSAVEIQKVLEGRNYEQPASRRMEFRLGVNLGDVIEEEDGTIYGDGVNIAARMEALADPGGICISSTVYDAVHGKLDFGFDFLGEQQVKNIERPISVYRVRTSTDSAPVAATSISPMALKLAAGIAGAAVVIAALIIWRPDPDVDETETAPPGPINQEQSAELAAVPPLPEGPKIAVLPFRNLSDDPAQDIFSRGLTEDISIALSRFSNLFVIAAESTLRYRDQDIDAPTVGRELGVNYVLEGSVRQSNQRIRINAQLLEIETLTRVWGDSYDRDLTTEDIFAIHDNISDNIASRLGGELGQISQAFGESLDVTATRDLEAYACVLRAHGFYDKITADEHSLIRNCLERAVTDNPDYAEAWAWLAYMYRDEAALNLNLRTDGKPALDRALQAAQRAVALAPDEQLSHDVLASVYFNRHELDLSRIEAMKAIELNPNSSRTVAWMGSMMALAGDWEYGISWLRRSMALNPHHPGWYYIMLGNYYYIHKRDFEQALVEFQKVNMPGWYLWHFNLAMAYGQLGRLQEAQSQIDKLLDVMPDAAERFRDEWRKWNFSEEAIELSADGLRKAGLKIPDEPPPSH